jgi:hypothetical protein
MAASLNADTKPTSINPCEPVPCQVLNTSGTWIGGYELLRFCDDGLLTIRSTRTGAIRQLPPERWRDPIEQTLLEAATSRL